MFDRFACCFFYNRIAAYGMTAAILSAISLMVQHGAAQRPGDLDTLFGNGGKVITRIGNAFDFANATAVQADGKIIAAGLTSEGPIDSDNFAITRYNADGTLDTTFGSGGKVVTDIRLADTIEAIAIQSDGKIVAAGYSNSQTEGDFALARYNTDGSLDSSFGINGIVLTSYSFGSDNAFAVAIQSDGKIVSAGTTIIGFDTETNFLLMRHNPDGSLDTSFGTGGMVITQFSESNFPFDVAYAVVIQRDGKIVAAGRSFDDYVNSDFSSLAVARYYSNGTLDATFATGGKFVSRVGGESGRASALAIQSDGKLVAAGSSQIGNISAFALARLSTSGLLDATFGNGGIVVTSVDESSYASGVAIQPNGKIVAAGNTGANSNDDFALTRYDTEGKLDTSFGERGKVVTPIGTASDGASALSIQSNGRIIAVGSSTIKPNEVAFALVRYFGDLPVRASEFDFDGDDRSDISVFRPTDGTWYLQRSQAGFYAAQFGLGTDKITPADFDGDRRADIAIYRPSTGIWYVLNSSNGTVAYYQFGLADDLPTPADYDGDGKADVSVFRASTGTWYRQNSGNGSFFAIQFGASEDKPTVGDFDGDGKSDVAVFRPSTGAWYQVYSSDGSIHGENFGFGTDILVPADYDGDGKSDVAVFRASDRYWYARNSSDGAFTYHLFGLATDIPAPGDFDGDGKADINVFRPSDGTWYRQNSSNGQFIATPFGTNGDKPTMTAFRY